MDTERTAGVIRRLWSSVESVVRLVSATVIIGAIGGFTIGGLGGRLAMRILFITSDSSVKGLESDDGFEIGRFTLGNTVSLLIVTTFIGVLAALLYLLAHPFVVRLGVNAVAWTALFYGVIGASLMVHPDGVDFRRLDPVALGIVMFVAICAGFGAAVAAFLGRATQPGGWPERASWWVLGPPLAFLVVPPFTVVAIVAAVINRSARDDGAERWWNVLHAAALVVMAALFVLGAINLASDITTLT